MAKIEFTNLGTGKTKQIKVPKADVKKALKEISRSDTLISRRVIKD